MEKKQLNLSAPLISARRYSSPLRRSGEEQKPESAVETQKAVSWRNGEEVGKPGSIPFMWEQIPGQAKSSDGSQLTSPDEIPSTPRLPTSRNSDVMPFPPGRKSGELTNGIRTSSKLSGELIIPRMRNKLSGELNVFRPHTRLSGELNTLKTQRLSGELNTVRGPKFSGELYTLQPYNKFSGDLTHNLSKYYSMNNGQDTWNHEELKREVYESSETDVDDDATFSDAHTQLESFSVNCSVSGVSGSERPDAKPSATLPADKKSREFMMNRFLPAAKAMTLEPSQYATRKHLSGEQPKESKALIPRPRTPPPSQNVCSIVPYTGQDIGSEESEEDEEIPEERSAISVKIKSCGFLPWFCSKNSLRLFNPLPSMKSTSKSALSSASKVTNLVKNKSWRSPSPKAPKKVSPVHKSCELQKPKYASRPMFYSGELQTTRSGSPFRSSRMTGASPYRNESPHYQKGVGYLAASKRVAPHDDDIRSKLAQRDLNRLHELKRKTGTRSPTVGKMLYKESVNITKVSHSLLNVSKTKSGPLHFGKTETPLNYGGRLDLMKARGMSGPLVYNSSEKHSKRSANENTNTCRELVAVGNDDSGTAMQSPFTPPLPKSPSESWLSRNLPAVSPRNSVSYSSLNSKIQSRKQNPKWETIVKSSHLRHDHGRYSEELITHIPQRPQAWK